MASRPPSPPVGPASYSQFSSQQSSSAAFTLLDTLETFLDSRVDLFQRSLQAQTERIKAKMKAEMRDLQDFKIRDLSGQIRDLSGEVTLPETFEREVKNFKVKVSARITALNASWETAKVVRTREKISFFIGVNTLLVSALLFGLAPEWIHVIYTLCSGYMLPMRAYTYKKRSYHYFLFDLCYYVTILNFVYLWILPSSTTLFVACYCLSHGSLASAVITWRNSLVFHDQDKVTSLFVHIYAPFTFTVIRHFYPNSAVRFPAVAEVPHIWPASALLISAAIYAVWQGLYWKLVLVDRRTKIESGQRTTSFSFLLNDKRGAIGRSLASVPPQYREAAFMAGQLVYAVLTQLPAIYLLYDSPFWSGAFLLFIFGVSVWNGGGFYIEVFGRKFERELEALRKELADATSSQSGRSGHSTPSGLHNHSRDSSAEDLTSMVSATTQAPVSTPDSSASSESSLPLANKEDKKTL